ncbi:MAG TPA: DHHA1 domain-containing protein [Vicinamibacterales bacterium]|jgi:alanyl-tRNA synthetase
MTDRLYYTDPYRTEFDAAVLEAMSVGGKPAVVLDTTAFYPTSGGQPFDTGSLGPARVLDVVESDAGQVVHVLDRELAAGDRVHGLVNWDRRFDHMQQHTGQHILSAAFDRLHKARTVGFHLGAVVSTIDLAVELSPQAIAEAETESNRLVFEDRPVAIRFVSGSEAAALPLRKESERTGTLRIIDVSDYDLSACGGTHVARTGAVGLIAVLSSERVRGGTRVEFACGHRALRAFRTFHEAVAACIHHLSVAPDELPAAIERLQAESKDHRKAIRGLQERLAEFEAAALADAAEDVGGSRHVIQAVEGQDQNGLKAMALAICGRPGYQVALFSTTTPTVAVLARSTDRPMDAGALLRALTAQFGGRGGGKPELAQGGGLAGPLGDILRAAREAMLAAK